MTVNLKNNETGTVNVNGKDRTIVTPLITPLWASFWAGCFNVTAEHGMIESAAKAALPPLLPCRAWKDSCPACCSDEWTASGYLGHRDCGSRCGRLYLPQVMVACATSTAALGTDNVFVQAASTT